MLSALEARTRLYECVDFNYVDGPEDHLYVNLRAAWSKANDYYNKLDDSPVYYAAVCLHPYYKYYCDNSWADKPEWLASAAASFNKLWKPYRPQNQRQRPPQPSTSLGGIDDVIGAFVSRNTGETVHNDEYERWKVEEPSWTKEQYLGDGNPIIYWIQLRSRYPHLSQFAIDILTIPASSCECERLFSELGDLLEPKRRGISSELLAALQLVRSWTKAGFDKVSGVSRTADDNNSDGDSENEDDDSVSDEEIVQDYNIQDWVNDPQ